jgi:hypothetical protein
MAKCFTVNEFCAAHRIGLNTYYRLRKAEIGPNEIHVFSKVLITEEAAALWRAERDAEARRRKKKGRRQKARRRKKKGRGGKA